MSVVIVLQYLKADVLDGYYKNVESDLKIN